MAMKARKLVIITFFLLGFVSLTVVSPMFAQGATRQSKLLNFIKNCKDEGGGFYEYKGSETSSEVSLDATRASISALKEMNSLAEIDQTSSIIWLGTQFKLNADNDNNTINFAYTLEALEALGGLNDIDNNSKFKMSSYLNSCQEFYGQAVGYSITEESNATIQGTYFTLKCFYHLGNNSIGTEIQKDHVTEFILSCLDSNGGFKSNSSGDLPSLINTFYAIKALYFMDEIGEIDVSDIVKINSFINSFYVNDENLKNHYGGFSFLPEDEITYSSFMATFYAVTSLNILNGTLPSTATINWVMNQQNPADGGFSENPIEGGTSSTLTSFYAVQILESRYSDLSILQQEAWGLVYNWILVVIIIAVIAGVIIAGLYIYKR
ncbi:MAG: prenyltransferase/squalene oxidase repeat-containing protein, partial [Promethearchaeota archaeon]